MGRRGGSSENPNPQLILQISLSAKHAQALSSPWTAPNNVECLRHTQKLLDPLCHWINFDHSRLLLYDTMADSGKRKAGQDAGGAAHRKKKVS